MGGFKPELALKREAEVLALRARGQYVLSKWLTTMAFGCSAEPAFRMELMRYLSWGLTGDLQR